MAGHILLRKVSVSVVTGLRQKAQRAYIFVEMPKNIAPGPAGGYLFTEDTAPLGRGPHLNRQNYKDIGPLGLISQPLNLQTTFCLPFRKS